MKLINKILFSIVFLFTLSSCSDFLDQVPEEKLSEEILFESKDDVVKVLTQIYNEIPDRNAVSGDRSTPGLGGDDVDIIWNNYDYFKKDQGQYSASSPIFDRWKIYYTQIRLAMYFISRIDECKDEKLTEDERKWWKGEAYFLQAYYYFWLLQMYGPVPVMEKVYLPSEIDGAVAAGIPRATFDQCVNHIDGLLEEAYNNLDLFYTSSSTERAARASKAAAKFLQARLWLYAASPLYNGMKSPVTNKDYSYLNPKGIDGEGLISTTADPTKWKKAMDVAQEAIDVCTEAGRGLFKPAGETGYSAYVKLMNYARGGEPNIENVYYRQDHSTGTIRSHSLPISWSGYSGICPTVEHVNEYFMANGLMPEDEPSIKGLSITDTETYDSEGRTFKIPKKYMKRDPRFYSNILFPGQYSYAVLGNEVESTSTRWAYNTDNSFKDEVWYRPYSNTQDGFEKKTGRDYTTTGYLHIKFVGKQDNKTSKGEYAVAIFRLAELYLNYTEAAFEYTVSQGGNPATTEAVFTYWDKIRDRVEIPRVRAAYSKAGITLTTAKLRELVRREREIELAYEAHRYFDNRRWLVAEREGGAKHGMDIFKTETGGFGNESYVFETRTWDDKMYFLPIKQSEIDKNPGLTQNALW